MIKFLKNIFTKKDTLVDSYKSEDDINSYFKGELDKSEFIKPEKFNLVLDHLNHKINLNKTDNKLSASEKKELGLNSRLSITKELVEVLTEKGITQSNPKEILISIYCKATFKKRRNEDFVKFKNLNITHYKLMDYGDERDCKWCKSMNNKKLPLSQDINELIEQNCTCESHCRLIVQADINLEAI